MTEDQEKKLTHICDALAGEIFYHIMDHHKKTAVRERVYQLATEIIKISKETP